MALLISASASLAAECAVDPKECTLKKLCEVATTVDGNNTTWSTATGSAEHVTLAQSLGMECGVTPIVDLCDTDPNECKVSQICGKATTDNAGQKSWDASAAAHVAKAKEYGLQCNVSEEITAEKVTTDFKQAFKSESKLKRQQLQYALKKLGYYAYGADGLWGKGTSSAIIEYAQSNGVSRDSPSGVFSSILSKVDVPSSFAAPKSTSASSVARNKLYECTRMNLPAMGFASRSAAESWYPKEIQIVIAADDSWMSGPFGDDTNRSEWSKRNKHLNVMAGDTSVMIQGKSLNNKNKSKVWMGIGTELGTQMVGQAEYECSKAMATSWQPG